MCRVLERARGVYLALGALAPMVDGKVHVKLLLALAEVADIHDITYKDTASYFNILYKGNVRKWICRIRINSAGRALIIPDESKKETVYTLTDIYDLKQYKDQLCEVLKRYL